MAFILRRPLAVAAAIKQAPKLTSASSRALHFAAPLGRSQTSLISSSPIAALAKSRQVIHRTYMQSTPIANPNTGDFKQRLIYGAAIVGGALVVTNLVFNRETREDGGMPPFERAYLNETFLHTGLGVGIIGVAARALHQSGWSVRLMASNPWLVIGGSLALSFGTMLGCRATDPQK